MITAMYICEPTILSIVTHENNLQLCKMGDTIPTPLGVDNRLDVERGIYKIISTMDVAVTGTSNLLFVQKVSPKTGTVEQLVRSVAESFADVTLLQMQSFFAVADGRDYLDP